MENKEIYIDGVNVAGCVQLIEEPFYPCGLGGECKGWENCYYKQLKRLEQENKTLKNSLKDFQYSDEQHLLKVIELEQENKSLYEEKNCLHKIIDRLLENAGYSKDIASAEDFEDVYEDMQIKRNELIELEQENEKLKQEVKQIGSDFIKKGDYARELEKENKELKEENVKLLFGKGALINLCDNLTKIIDEKKEKENKLWQALEEIRNYCDRIEQGSVIGTQDCLINSIKNITNEALNESK